MKNTILLFFLGWVPNIMLAQGIVVSADKMNVAYVGVDNPMTIVAGQYSCDQLVVSADNGTLKSLGDCRFDFHPKKTGMVDIVVNARTSKGLKQVGTTRFRVKSMPEPHAAIAGKSGGDISTAAFKEQLGVSMLFEDVDYDIKGAVTVFRISFLYVEGEVFKAENSGAIFSPEVRDAMKKLRAGDKVIVEGIRGIIAGGCATTLNTIVFTLD
jgi:hypothetical protein